MHQQVIVAGEPTARRSRSLRLGGVLLVLASVSSVVACSDDDDRAEASDRVESFLAALDAALDAECTCRQVAEATCSSAKQSVHECVNGAVSAGSQAAEQFPRCAVQSGRDYNACVRARGMCGADGIEGIEECDQAIEAGDCELPAAVQSCLSGGTPAMPTSTSTTPGSTPATPSAGCSDQCEFADDGECDDGGPGADYNACTLGSDCTDCGAR